MIFKTVRYVNPTTGTCLFTIGCFNIARRCSFRDVVIVVNSEITSRELVNRSENKIIVSDSDMSFYFNFTLEASDDSNVSVAHTGSRLL